MELLKDTIGPKISKGIAEKKFSDEELADYIKTGSAITYVFEIEIEHGLPIIRHLEFILNRDNSIRPRPGVERIPSVFYLRKNVNNDSIRRATPSNWIDTPDIDTLLGSLMKAGISADKIESGGRISIVRINRSKGLQWVDSGACGNQTDKKK